MPLHHNSATYTIQQITDNCKYFFIFFTVAKNEILNSTTTFGGGIYSRTVKVYSFI